MTGNQNNWIYDMSTGGFLMSLHINHAVGRRNLWLFICFYYSQIMRTFTRNFYCFIIHIQNSFPRTPSEYFCTECIVWHEPFWDTRQTFYFLFSITRRWVSLQKMQLGYWTKLWMKLNETCNKNLVQNKLISKIK